MRRLKEKTGGEIEKRERERNKYIRRDTERDKESEREKERDKGGDRMRDLAPCLWFKGRGLYCVWIHHKHDMKDGCLKLDHLFL